MSALGRFLTVVHMTLHEAARRRIMFTALLGALAFLVLYGIGFHFVAREVGAHGPESVLQKRIVINFFVIAGLFATNFLSVLSAVLLPIDTLSGEISSGVIQTLASKPVRRSEILLGKWFAYWLVCAGYLLLVAGGVLAIAWFRGHFMPPNPVQGLACMLLEMTCFVTLSIAGGARLSTVTNGVVAFALFGLAFIGSTIEQVASMTGNLAARNVGAITSLLVPTDVMWRLAAHVMQPRVMSELHTSPFSMGAVPSAAMVWWAGGWACLVLAVGLRGFSKRPL